MTPASTTPPTQSDVNAAYDALVDATGHFYDTLTAFVAAASTGTDREWTDTKNAYSNAKRVHSRAESNYSNVVCTFRENHYLRQ